MYNTDLFEWIVIGDLAKSDLFILRSNYIFSVLCYSLHNSSRDLSFTAPPITFCTVSALVRVAPRTPAKQVTSRNLCYCIFPFFECSASPLVMLSPIQLSMYKSERKIRPNVIRILLNGVKADKLDCA